MDNALNCDGNRSTDLWTKESVKKEKQISLKRTLDFVYKMD